MSFDALAWAAKQKTGGLATKAVLLALANYSDKEGCSYPSTAAIAEFGEMDHKTATVALDRLTKAGLIEDTGGRQGRTKQVKVYRLRMERQPETEAFQNRKPSEIPAKAPQKRGTDTVIEPVPKKATPPLVERASKATLVPSNFLPVPKDGSLTAKAMAAWPPGEIEEQVEHFVDRHTSTGTLSKDWQASWRTWVKNWKKFNGNGTARTMDGQPNIRGSRPDPALDMLHTAQAAQRLGPSSERRDHREAGVALPALWAG